MASKFLNRLRAAVRCAAAWPLPAFFRAIFHIAFTDTSASQALVRELPVCSHLCRTWAVKQARHLTLAATLNVIPRSLISRNADHSAT